MPAPFAMPCRGAVLVALLVFRALGVLSCGPGWSMRPWAAVFLLVVCCPA